MDDDLAEHRQKYREAIARARSEGQDRFQAWFNTSADVRETLIQSHWDLAVHVLTPAVVAHLENPQAKTALEIGYGGGRLLCSASRYFGKVIGVDIHGEEEAVRGFLREQGVANYELHTTDGRSLPVADASVDFVFSFIVLQHLPSYATFLTYLREAYRSLVPRGVAQLYFGDIRVLGRRFRCLHPFLAYREMPAVPANEISLVLRRSHVAGLARDLGFRVVDSGPSYHRVPDGYPYARGLQSYVTLVK